MHRELPEQSNNLRKKDSKSIDSRFFHALSPEENVSVNDQGYLILDTYLSIILATMAESGEML